MTGSSKAQHHRRPHCCPLAAGGGDAFRRNATTWNPLLCEGLTRPKASNCKRTVWKSGSITSTLVSLQIGCSVPHWAPRRLRTGERCHGCQREDNAWITSSRSEHGGDDDEHEDNEAQTKPPLPDLAPKNQGIDGPNSTRHGMVVAPRTRSRAVTVAVTFFPAKG